MAVNICNIPPNAVQLLFAEDLMQWLLRRQAGIHYQTEKAGPYRDFIFNVFNEDVRQAVTFIEVSLEREIDDEFSNLEEVNEKTFLDYALYCEETYFKKGFLANYFLEYCVRLVSMAVTFSLFNVPEALNISIRIILKLLEDRGMFTGGWDALIMVARIYAKIYKDCRNTITPENSDDERPAQNLAPAGSSKNEPPAHSSDDEPPGIYSSDDEPPGIYSSDDELLASSSADGLYMKDENKACDYVSNRNQLLKPEREFKTDYLSAAKEDLQPERSSKATTNACFNSGQAFEGTSSTYES